MSLRFCIETAELTPPLGVPMSGYAARTELARGTMDALCCKVAAFRDDGACVVLIALDLLLVGRAWADEVRVAVAKRVGTTPESVLIAATHTHSGPAVFMPGMRRYLELKEFERQLAELVVETAARAVNGAAPVELAYKAVRVLEVAGSRRVPGEQIDDAVRVVAAYNLGWKCVGVVASFGCHPTVLPPTHCSYSRDLFGAAIDRAEVFLRAPVLLFNGAAADVSTRFTRSEQSIGEVQDLGVRLGHAIVKAAADARAVDKAPVEAVCRSVPITLRQFPTIEAAQAVVETALSERDELLANGINGAHLRRANVVLEGALAQLALSAQGGAAALLGYQPTTALVQRLGLGGCDVIGIGGEVTSRSGFHICSEYRRPTLLAGYANDYLGYLVPPDTVGGYEALISVVDSDSILRILRASTAL